MKQTDSKGTSGGHPSELMQEGTPNNIQADAPAGPGSEHAGEGTAEKGYQSLGSHPLTSDFWTTNDNAGQGSGKAD